MCQSIQSHCLERQTLFLQTLCVFCLFKFPTPAEQGSNFHSTQCHRLTNTSIAEKEDHSIQNVSPHPKLIFREDSMIYITFLLLCLFARDEII